MELGELTTAVERRRMARVNGSVVVHQPVTLIWAARRAIDGQPRQQRWSVVRHDLSAAICALGGGSETDVAAYPVVALRDAPFWDLDFSTEAPAAHGGAPRRWLQERDPRFGLTAEAYELLTIRQNLEKFAQVAVARLDEPQANTVLAWFDLDVPIFRGFGEVPGVPEGTTFENRRALAARQVHRANQAGITGTAANGAESIVVSGGYEDDKDEGNRIVYTGHGGRDPNSGRQVADQSFESPGNAALMTSHLSGAPVRVIRGPHPQNPHAPRQGYRYDGLFTVASWWEEVGLSGFNVCRFELLKLIPTVTDGSPTAPPTFRLPEGTLTPERKTTVALRISRRIQVSLAIKKLHDHTCQVCDTKLVIEGRGYAEGAHIRPLGSPHDGRDTPDNMLCLCPNCHVLFDNGGIQIDEDLRITSAHPHRGVQRTATGHSVSADSLAYHRRLFPGTSRPTRDEL
jgi:putative restriction endonuclease